MSEENVYHLRSEWMLYKLDDRDFEMRDLPVGSADVKGVVWRGEGGFRFGRFYSKINRTDGSVFWADDHHAYKPEKRTVLP